MPHRKPQNCYSPKNESRLTPTGPGLVYSLESTIVHIVGARRVRPMRVSAFMDNWVPNIPGFSITQDMGFDYSRTFDSLLLNKIELCRKHGVLCREKHWAETGIPLVIESTGPVEIASAIGVNIVRHPDCRPEFKSKLEVALGIFAKALERAANPDTAVKVLLMEIMHWNNQRLEQSAMPSIALEHEIRPSPVTFANWGMCFITGSRIKGNGSKAKVLSTHRRWKDR